LRRRCEPFKSNGEDRRRERPHQEAALCSNRGRHTEAMPPEHPCGYSLVELLIVVAIIAILAAIAIPGYQEMLYNAQIVSAVADIKQISSAITAYRLSSGQYPASLQDVGMDGKLDPWGRPYEYLQIAGKKGKNGEVRKDKNLVPLNSDYDLYSCGRDGMSVSPLTAQQSRDDIVRANNGAFVGLATNY
jgi:general secretion pathway protein G